MMTPRFALVLCIVVLVAGLITQSAAAVKYSQPPNTGSSYSFSSEVTSKYAIITADDWTCTDGTPIVGIRWWGSYWYGSYAPYSDGLNGASPVAIDYFVIGIFPNLPADANVQFDRPDSTSPLAAWQVSKAQANETYAFTVNKFGSIPENIYSYYVDLTQAQSLISNVSQFNQQSGTKYWLCIVAHHSSSNVQWGWHEAANHYGSYAVQSYATGSGSQLDWFITCGGHDMAFELIPIPEPGSLCVLAAGLLGTASFIGIRRRRS